MGVKSCPAWPSQKLSAILFIDDIDDKLARACPDYLSLTELARYAEPNRLYEKKRFSYKQFAAFCHRKYENLARPGELGWAAGQLFSI